MDAGNLSVCGEESLEQVLTIREKDGILRLSSAWLQLSTSQQRQEARGEIGLRIRRREGALRQLIEGISQDMTTRNVKLKVPIR